MSLIDNNRPAILSEFVAFETSRKLHEGHIHAVSVLYETVTPRHEPGTSA
jgi:hypothetical protein